jgi:integrase
MASFRKKGRFWYYRYTDQNGDKRERKGHWDLATTKGMAANTEADVSKIRSGYVDPKTLSYAANEGRPLSDHINAWEESLRSKGATSKHVALFTTRARRVVALLMGARLSEVEPARNARRTDVARAEANLMKWITSARLSDVTAERVQNALGILRAEGRSLQTCNHHRAAARAFSRWCDDTNRTRDDALRGVKGYNVQEDRRHDRRTVSLEELRKLIDAAENGPEVMGMTGPVRALCYRLAVASGLRYSEIAGICPESFDWNAPSVTVAACYTKDGDPAMLPSRAIWRGI